MEYRSQKGSWRHVGSDGGGGNRRFLKNGQRNGGGSGGGRHYNRHGQQQNHHSCRGSYWFKGEGYNDHEPLNIEEEVVGINGFKCPEKKGFQGIIKQRFSDFIMNEISSKGQIIQLTSILKKKKNIQAAFTERVCNFAYEKSITSQCQSQSHERRSIIDLDPQEIILSIQIIKEMAKKLEQKNIQTNQQKGKTFLQKYHANKLFRCIETQLGSKMGKEFEIFFLKCQNHQAKDKKYPLVQQQQQQQQQQKEEEKEAFVFFISGLNEKKERILIHEAIRKFGRGIIVADTITSPEGSKVIRVRHATIQKNAKGKSERDEWPVDQPDYLQFVLLKRNKDIVSVFSQIATVLRVNQSIFAYADLKDKRGVTTQVCTAYHLPKERLHEIMKPHKDFKEVPFVIGNPRYVSHKITPNDCQGNQISMVIRAIPSSCSNEEIDSCVNHWVQNGFINYYGLQRFGANSTLYHLIGRAILRNDFKLASMLLLRPQEGEATKLREAREHFRQHKDVAAALRMFPPYLVPEKAILEGLQKNGMEAYEEAFKNVPFHVRRQYVEAYQFYIWNRIASERFTTQYDRTKPVVGDLVYLKAPEHDKEPTKKKQKLFNSTLAPPTSSKTSDSKPQVIALTKENIHDYSIYDVVLPVPGHSCMYPSNALGNLLEKTLYSDGVDFKALATLRAGSNPNDQYNLAGSYRHVVSRPNRVSHTIKKYDDSTIPLFLDDIDRLQGKKQAPQSLSDGSHRALCLQFQLGTSCDASIAIRELLKQSSSVHVQLQLSEKNADNNIKNSVRLERSGNTQSSPDRSNRMKRSRSSISADMKKIKETKVVTKKKMQVAIGRPGFSLGRC